MNKKFLALAVAAASISTAASAATVYKDDTSTLNIGGRVEVRGNISSANKSDADDNKYNDASRVRLNIGGEQKLNDDISFIGFTEYEITENNDAATSDDTAFNTRYLYAGITSQRFGALTYGHQNTSFTYITDWTDRAENFTGDINEYNAATSDRADNVLRYALTVDRLTIQAHVQADSNGDGNNLTNHATPSTDGFGVIAAYKLTDELEVGAGYAQTDGNSTGDAQDTGDNLTYTGAIKYVRGGLWLAATYEGGTVSGTENSVLNTPLTGESDFNAVDAFAGYTFGDNNVNMSYNYFDADEDNYDSLNENNLNLEYARYFGQNVTAFVSYRINLLSDGDAATSKQTDDQAMLGLRYAF